MSDHGFKKAHDDAISCLGLFVVGWSTIEALLEVAIAKQLGLAPAEGSIITASLQFKSRSVILMGLLNRDKTKNAAAITSLKTLQNKPDRNDLLHSIIGRSATGLVFTRRKSDGKFSSQEKPHDAESLLLATIELTNIANELKIALGISEQDIQDYFDTAHKAANSA